MKVTQHHSIEELEQILKLRKYSDIRDRVRAVIYAIKGDTAESISVRLGYHWTCIQTWVYRYRDEGFNGFFDRPRSGQPTKLLRAREEEFKQRLEAGPLPGDKISAFRGKDIQKILKKEFQAEYALNGVYDLLHRLKYSFLCPRPKHRKNDLQKMKDWKEKAPLLSKKFKNNIPIKKLKFGSKMKLDLDNLAH